MISEMGDLLIFLDQVEVLKIELERLRKENEDLRLALDIIGSKYEALQARLQTSKVTISSDLGLNHHSNKRPRSEEVAMAKASQVLVRANPEDKSLVSYHPLSEYVL